MKVATSEPDPETSQIEGVGFRDLRRILAKHKLPTEEEELQQMRRAEVRAAAVLNGGAER